MQSEGSIKKRKLPATFQKSQKPLPKPVYTRVVVDDVGRITEFPNPKDVRQSSIDLLDCGHYDRESDGHMPEFSVIVKRDELHRMQASDDTLAKNAKHWKNWYKQKTNWRMPRLL